MKKILTISLDKTVSVAPILNIQQSNWTPFTIQRDSEQTKCNSNSPSLSLDISVHANHCPSDNKKRYEIQ